MIDSEDLTEERMMATWRLVDGRDPVERPDRFPTKLISSEAELRQELDRLRLLEPGIVSLTSPDGESLQLGIGGPCSALRWYGSDNKRSRDLLAHRPYHSNRIDFLAEGDTIAFWPEQLMPVDQVTDIVVYFFKHHHLPDRIALKEWDSARNKWITRPAVQACSA
jgi:hypothetical protein